MEEEDKKILIAVTQLQEQMKHMETCIHDIASSLKSRNVHDITRNEDTKVRLSILETKSNRALITSVVTAIAVVGAALMKMVAM